MNTMSTAPKDRRILIKDVNDQIHCADYAINPFNGDIGYKVINLPTGEGVIISNPVGWCELPSECNEPT